MLSIRGMSGSVAGNPLEALLGALRPKPNRVNLGGGLSLAFCPIDGPDTRRQLVALLQSTAASSSSSGQAPSFHMPDSTSGATSAVFALLMHRRGEIHGWVGYRRLHLGGRRCIYVDGITLLDTQRDMSLMVRLIGALARAEFLRSGLKQTLIAAVTTSPSVYAALSQVVGEREVFPYRSDDTPPDIQDHGRRLLDRAGATGALDIQTLVLREDDSKFPEERLQVPVCTDRRMVDFFDRTLRGREKLLVIARVRIAGLVPHLLASAARPALRRWILRH